MQEYVSLPLQFQLRAAQCSWATEQQSGRDKTGHKSTNELVSGIARLFSSCGLWLIHHFWLPLPAIFFSSKCRCVRMAPHFQKRICTLYNGRKCLEANRVKQCLALYGKDYIGVHFERNSNHISPHPSFGNILCASPILVACAAGRTPRGM